MRRVIALSKNAIQITECGMLNEHRIATCRGCCVYLNKNEYAKVIWLVEDIEYGQEPA